MLITTLMRVLYFKNIFRYDNWRETGEGIARSSLIPTRAAANYSALVDGQYTRWATRTTHKCSLFLTFQNYMPHCTEFIVISELTWGQGLFLACVSNMVALTECMWEGKTPNFQITLTMKLMLNQLSKVSMRADPDPMYSIGVSQFIVVKSNFLVLKKIWGISGNSFSLSYVSYWVSC